MLNSPQRVLPSRKWVVGEEGREGQKERKGSVSMSLGDRVGIDILSVLS
jgi:hypothetical protein